ncbi:AEC family transporter [Schwartzia sp. (in: firmicutes)]
MDFTGFQIAFKAVVPVFVLIGVGLVIRLRKLLTDDELKRVNGMVFQIFFFIMLFYSTYTTNIRQTFQPRLIAFALCSLAVIYLVPFFLVPKFEPTDKRRGAMIQAIYRSNFVLLGIPLVANLFGEENIAVTTMMIAVVVPIYNVLGVMTLEIFRGGKVAPLQLFKNVLKNPMIAGALCGLAFLVLGIPIPNVVMKPLHQISVATTPIALIILGASFHLGTTGTHRKQLIACIISRLIIIPAFVLSAGAFFGFRGVEFATLIAIFASPCAVAGFAMAQQMDSDADLAGNCVVFTTALSCLTLFGWIVIFHSLGVL